MTNIIIVNINGSPYNCKNRMTLYDLITYLNFNPELIAIEYNYQVVSTNLWKDFYVNNNDNIEIVTMVGGG
nr:thiamine-biosynthesis [Cavernulicola chilensis]